jgi:hypothetical protein
MAWLGRRLRRNLRNLRITRHAKQVQYVEPQENQVKCKIHFITGMKTQRGIHVELYSFCNLDARWGGWTKPRPARLTPR